MKLRIELEIGNESKKLEVPIGEKKLGDLILLGRQESKKREVMIEQIMKEGHSRVEALALFEVGVPEVLAGAQIQQLPAMMITFLSIWLVEDVGIGSLAGESDESE